MNGGPNNRTRLRLRSAENRWYQQCDKRESRRQQTDRDAACVVPSNPQPGATAADTRDARCTRTEYRVRIKNTKNVIDDI